jgi:NADH:ubiquinone oxidoreductase subunit E
VVKDSLGVREGETTEDFMFSGNGGVPGTCFLAPVMMIDRATGKLIPQRIPSIIHYTKKRKVMTKLLCSRAE